MTGVPFQKAHSCVLLLYDDCVLPAPTAPSLFLALRPPSSQPTDNVFIPFMFPIFPTVLLHMSSCLTLPSESCIYFINLTLMPHHPTCHQWHPSFLWDVTCPSLLCGWCQALLLEEGGVGGGTSHQCHSLEWLDSLPHLPWPYLVLTHPLWLSGC